jgi:hypothetical protein
MYGGREALPDDHKFRGQRGRVRARYRRPQLGRGTEKIGETSQRKTNLQLASGAFSCKVAPFTPAGERTKKAPSRGGRTGSNGQQHPVVIDCEVLQKRRSRCTTPGELRATRKLARRRVGGSWQTPVQSAGARVNGSAGQSSLIQEDSEGVCKARQIVTGTRRLWRPNRRAQMPSVLCSANPSAGRIR